MAHHDEATSEAEEMYLITIARAIEDGRDEPVPMSHVAGALEVSNVSANQMIRKLDDRGYVEYEPYRGVSFTDAGRTVAAAILRRRRLWGVFLSDQLGLSPGRADDVACDLEHVTPDDVVDRLSDFLGAPASGPRGRAIPDGDARSPVPVAAPLSELAAGVRATVVAVALAEPLAAFAVDQGLTPGAAVEVLGVGRRGDRLVSVDGAVAHLGSDVAGGILMEKPSSMEEQS